jgi:hypothetical protein
MCVVFPYFKFPAGLHFTQVLQITINNGFSSLGMTIFEPRLGAKRQAVKRRKCSIINVLRTDTNIIIQSLQPTIAASVMFLPVINGNQ